MPLVATTRSAPPPSLGRRGRAKSTPVGQSAHRTGDTVLCFLLGVYLASLVFEGPLRYALARTGFPNALYLRDAIPVGTLAFLFLRSLVVDKAIEALIAIPVALLIFHGALAAIFGVSFFSILFGFKIFMFLPYGMVMWPLIRSRFETALTAASIIFVVTIAGVLLNFLLERLPWEGFEYESAFGTVTTTRMWWIPGGISRLPGFTRTSFNAAMILGITGLLTMVKLRRLLPSAAVAVMTVAALLATTSKGMILAFPIAALWLLVEKGQASGRVLVYALCALTLVFPFVIVLFDLGSSMPASAFPPLIVSAWERFTMMWPLAFDLLPDGPAAALGAGLGSIGTPQLYGDAPHRVNAADSLAVFMMINFGLLGLLYYVAPALGQRRVAEKENAIIRRAYTGVLVIAYGYGISISMIEESFFAICLGLGLGAMATAYLQAREERAL
jgi:hypothetical protein